VKNRDQLLADRCRPRTGALADDDIAAQLAVLPGWRREGDAVARTFHFADYYETIAFVNALAWIVHAEDHHPELAVGYDRCAVRFSTHSAGGISDNDFICAAKADALFLQRAKSPAA
jgi:4a-hydroxytetrahydrobiopterin dehydratase